MNENTGTGLGLYLFCICLFVAGIAALVCYATVLEGRQTPTAAATVQGIAIRVKVSWYWPPLGGTNCSRFIGGECVARMASGKPWQDWVGKAVACPPEYEFGTQFIIGETTWVCMDRGGGINRINENLVWVDMLTPKPVVPYGTVLDAQVVDTAP